MSVPFDRQGFYVICNSIIYLTINVNVQKFYFITLYDNLKLQRPQRKKKDFAALTEQSF